MKTHPVVCSSSLSSGASGCFLCLSEAAVRQASALPEPTIIFHGGTGPRLQVLALRNRLWGHLFFCLISLEVTVKGCVKKFCSQRPLTQHNQD